MGGRTSAAQKAIEVDLQMISAAIGAVAIGQIFLRATAVGGHP
ncbi:MAG TPA: hypothetical protein VLZ05_01040 [Mycobacterium sp.]|nr:hypothetical protein [Mycobacterium sp.]HUH67577.1 hypothetical protein [Mycobacterium sp.]